MVRKMKNVENETHTHCRTWNMARNPKNVENEKCTLQDLEYGKKTLKIMEN
jgi:hypothetical protein